MGPTILSLVEKSSLYFISEVKPLSEVPLYYISLPLSPQVRDRLPHLKAIVQYSPEPVDAQQRDEGVMSWAEFMEIGHDVPDYEVQWRIEQQKPGHCASLIYTSGTTGQPKASFSAIDQLHPGPHTFLKQHVVFCISTIVDIKVR